MPRQPRPRRSTNSANVATAAAAPALLGSTLPRLWTPPLVTGPPGPCGCGCALTPDTSYGFDVVEFAVDVLHTPPRPWQRFAAIHGGELLPDGRPRARIVLLLAGRQNGKTWLPVTLSLYWQFVEAVPLILGTSTKLDYAKESWRKATKLAELVAARGDDEGRRIAELMPRPRWKREANGEQESWTSEDSRYKIAASNDEGGRSLTIDRGIADELRQHHDYSAWAAMEPACSPPDAQLWAMTNAGDDRSVVLNDYRAAALDHIEHGDGDPRLMLLEWSADDDADPLDPAALCQANPSVGYGLDLDVLLNAARVAVRTGGDALTAFKTERMCIRVRRLNPAIDPRKWGACPHLPADGLGGVRDRVAWCLDVAPDLDHATVYAAALLDDDQVAVDHVADWSGPDVAARVRAELPGLLAAGRPRVLGWFPDGPAAALAADLVERPMPGRRFPPPGVTVEAIKGETPAVCMGFAALVDARRLAHGRDPLLDAHVGRAEKMKRGDRWVFVRPTPPPAGDGDDDQVAEPTHVDAVYAAAGAAHLARVLPPPVGPVRLVVVDD